jgi:hypothetical protein
MTVQASPPCGGGSGDFSIFLPPGTCQWAWVMMILRAIERTTKRKTVSQKQLVKNSWSTTHERQLLYFLRGMVKCRAGPPSQACPPRRYRVQTPSQQHSKFSSVSGFSGPEQLAQQADSEQGGSSPAEQALPQRRAGAGFPARNRNDTVSIHDNEGSSASPWHLCCNRIKTLCHMRCHRTLPAALTSLFFLFNIHHPPRHGRAQCKIDPPPH